MMANRLINWIAYYILCALFENTSVMWIGTSAFRTGDFCLHFIDVTLSLTHHCPSLYDAYVNLTFEIQIRIQELFWYSNSFYRF